MSSWHGSATGLWRDVGSAERPCGVNERGQLVNAAAGDSVELYFVLELKELSPLAKHEDQECTLGGSFVDHFTKAAARPRSTA